MLNIWRTMGPEFLKGPEFRSHNWSITCFLLAAKGLINKDYPSDDYSYKEISSSLFHYFYYLVVWDGVGSIS